MSIANGKNPIMPLIGMSTRTITDGGVTVTRHHKLATKGYSIATGTVEVKTPISLYEIEKAIEFVSGVLNRSINGMRGVEYRDPDDKYLGIGTWITDDKTACVTELVHIYPESWMSEDEARYIGRIRKQYAIYHLSDKRMIKTGYSETYQG